MINPKPRPCEELLARSVRGKAACARHQKPWVLAATVLGSTMAYVDESVVNVALPVMERDLNASLAAMQWVVNAYTLCVAALVLLGGAAGDQYGRRRIFAVGISIFAVTSLGCGFAASALPLIGARIAQGLGAALLIPCSLAIIGAAFDEDERGRAIGIWSGSTAIASGLAPLLGGWFVDHWSWRAIFLINPVLAVPTLWILFRYVPESRDSEARHGLDWRGALLAFAGLAALVYGLIGASGFGWSNPIVIGSLLAGALLLAGFLCQEKRSPAPLMPLSLFRSAAFSGVNLLTLFLYGGLSGAFFFLPFLLIGLHGYSALGAGAAFLPFTLIIALLSRWSGGLLDRFGGRLPLVLGPAIAALGLMLLAVPARGGSYWLGFLPAMIVTGIGMVVTVAPLTTTVLNSVDPRHTGVASGINNAVASVAGLLTVAMLGTVAITVYGRSLDHHLALVGASAEIRHAVDAMRGSLVATVAPGGLTQEAAEIARAVIDESLLEAFRLVLLAAAAMALAGAVFAALTIRPGEARSPRQGKTAAQR
jgi:EmrB/QacA subfamily drug resistance transporter